MAGRYVCSFVHFWSAACEEGRCFHNEVFDSCAIQMYNELCDRIV